MKEESEDEFLKELDRLERRKKKILQEMKNLELPKKIRKNNHTPAKQLSENRFARLSQVWLSLTIDEKRTWDKYIKESYPKYSKKRKIIKDPRQLFLSYNMKLLVAGSEINRTALRIQDIPESWIYATVDVIIRKKDFSMVIKDLSKIPENTKVIISATPILTSPSLKIDRRKYRVIKTIDSNFVPGSSIKEDYLRVFGKIGGVGEELSFRFTGIHKITGEKGGEFTWRTKIITDKNKEKPRANQ